MTDECANFKICGNQAAPELSVCFPCAEKIGTTDGTLEIREATHGSYAKTAQIAQRIKALINEHRDNLDNNQHEALDMIATKIARILSGNPNEPDHWHDIAGYARLVERELAK